MAAQQKQDGIEGIPADGANFFLRDFRKGKRGAPLEIDIVGEGEGS